MGDNRAFIELFDANTHEHIANLNVSAVEMWFSPDERFLFTKARNAIIKWDMDNTVKPIQLIPLCPIARQKI